MLDVVLPVERWFFYVVTHEEDAFRRCFDCKPNENDRRLSPKELFYCLKPLSDENRRFILGKLSDVSDGVINKLSKFVEEDNLDEFSNVINETDINTSSITTLCKRIIALIDSESAIEQLNNDLESIQYDDEKKWYRQLEKVFNLYITKKENVFNDKKIIDDSVEEINNMFETLCSINNPIDYYSDQTVRNYHKCLYFYHFINSADFASRIALDYLNEIVFNPKYEQFWKDYEDDSCLKELEKEMESLMDSIEESESKHGTKIANKWKLPADFFEPAYIDDNCPQDDYFPEFLEDLIQFEEQNEQHDEQNAKLRKEGLKKLSLNFSDFIDNLASKNYIINDNDNKLALARALTGRMVESSVKKVNWGKPRTAGTKNPHINSICFLITWLYPSTIRSLLGSGKYEHILTVFDGLEGTKPGTNAGVNVKNSPIKDFVKSFLLGLKECAPIVNNEKLDLRLQKFEEEYGKN